jgi:uncharacterized protein YndB with AHSA1/START domain
MSKLSVTAEPGKQALIITRTFDAPRELIFKAMTDPQMVPHWWGPRGMTTLVDKMDVRHGGVWRFVHRTPDGEETGFRGVYHHIVPNEQIVQTFEWEGLPGHISLETSTLEDYDGGTRIVNVAVYQSVADRDGMLNSGMEEGMAETYARLDEILAELKRVAA